MKIFRHWAEVCPHCGAVGSMSSCIRTPNFTFNGKSLTVDGERRTYVCCKKCHTHALRVVTMPPR